MKKNTLLLFPILVVLLGFSCKRNAELERFEDFYVRFLQDSAYQLQHVLFPLEGIPDNALGSGADLQNFRWEKSNWEIHKPIDFKTSDYTQELRTFGDELVIERITHESGDYGMLRRFARIDKEWMLIYYAGLNPIQK